MQLNDNESETLEMADRPGTQHYNITQDEPCGYYQLTLENAVPH